MLQNLTENTTDKWNLNKGIGRISESLPRFYSLEQSKALSGKFRNSSFHSPILDSYWASPYIRYVSKQIDTTVSVFSQLNNTVVLTDTRNYFVVF